jgi:hypothetical protein
MSNWFQSVATAIVVACAAPALAQTVHRSPDHWSITIPDGWELDTGERLAVFNQAATDLGASMHSAPSVHYVALLIPKNPDGRYILLQSQPAFPPGARLSDLQGVLDESSRRVQDELKQASVDSTFAPVLDRERNRVIMTGRVEMPGKDTSGILSITNFGAANNILVHAYAPEATFAAARPALEAIADSFAFDPGHAYAFRPDGIDWNRVLITAAVCGIAGAAFGWIRQFFKPKAE